MFDPQGGLNATVEGTAALSLAVSDAGSTNCDWGGPNQTICDRESVTIGQNWEAEGHPECWADDYCVRWFPEDGIETTNSNLQITVPPNQTTLYTFYITDSNGNLIGTIDILASGGQGSLSFLWSNGASTPQLSGVPPGLYSVTATDEQGCEASLEVNLPGLDGPDFTSTIVGACGDQPAYSGWSDPNIGFHSGVDPLEPPKRIKLCRLH